MSHPRRSRISGPRARSRFRTQRRTALPLYRHTGGSPMADTRKLSIRRGQVWTSLVRIAADARAEEYRARMMREADEHAKSLALVIEDEEICACRVEVTETELRRIPWTDGVSPDDPTAYLTLDVGREHIYRDLRQAQVEVDHLRATAPKVPAPRPGAERFEAPLVRDKATARAMANKYASAPAGTRAAHKRTGEGRDIVAALVRAGRTAARETAQKMRRAGFPPHYINLVLWEPIRVRREIAQYGGTFSAESR